MFLCSVITQKNIHWYKLRDYWDRTRYALKWRPCSLHRWYIVPPLERFFLYRGIFLIYHCYTSVQVFESPICKRFMITILYIFSFPHSNYISSQLQPKILDQQSELLFFFAWISEFSSYLFPGQYSEILYVCISISLWVRDHISMAHWNTVL